MHTQESGDASARDPRMHAEEILGRRIGLRVSLAEQFSGDGRRVWVISIGDITVYQIEVSEDPETVSLPKFLSSENVTIHKRLNLIRTLQNRENALSNFMRKHPTLADEVTFVYQGEIHSTDLRAYIEATNLLETSRRRLRQMCFESLSDLDVVRLASEFSPEEG